MGPKQRQVVCLSEIVVKYIASLLHQSAKSTSKACGKWRLSKSLKAKCEGSSENCRKYFVEVSNCIPANLYDDFMAKLQSLILSEKSLLDEIYYDAIGCLLNRFTRKLVLDKASMFQDSSMAIESFLKHIEKADRDCRLIALTKPVIDLIDFDFEPTLMKMASFANLHTLKLPGLKHIDIETDIMAQVLQLLQINCLHLHTLDLSESSVDNECCNVIAQMSGSLAWLNLNHCTKLESAGVLHLLKRLKKLSRIDALRGKSSNVQNALDIWLAENKENNNNAIPGPLLKLDNLTFMTFRDAHGISKVAPVCPSICEVRVIYNVFEFNYDASVDKCLVHLDLFPEFVKGNLRLYLDINCLNMLFVIQMRNLQLWGPSLKRLNLTEPEFLHPQTLNPFALQCANLEELVIVNPSTISDELFVGRVPDLAEQPFENLRKLTFEGEKLPMHVAKFLLGRCVMLQEISLILEVLKLEQFQGILKLMIDYPRPFLRRAGFYFSKCDPPTINDDETLRLSDILRGIIHSCQSLSALILYVRCGYQSLKEDLESLDKEIKSNNWDLDTQFEVILPRLSARR